MYTLQFATIERRVSNSLDTLRERDFLETGSEKALCPNAL